MRTSMIVFVVLGFFGTLMLGGCNIAGPVFLLVHGPEKTRKMHELEKERPTVILIDDRQNRIPRRALRLAMAEEAERTLLSTKTVEDMISGQSALAAAGNDRTGRPIPIVEIGRAVEAQVVIYVTVDQFALTPDGETYAPTARLRVKVIDVEQDARVWPADPAGHPIFVRPQVQSRDLPGSVAARFAVEDELARLAGLSIARLFHDHERPRGARVPD
jgi:hypothetical protein